ERARDRGRADRCDRLARGEGGRDRRTALRLAPEKAWRLRLDEADQAQLVEALRDLRVERARGDGRHDRVGRVPAELLGDLEGDGLRAFGVVRAQAHVDEAPGQLEGELDGEPAAVVVGPTDGIDGGTVDGGGDQLLRLEVGGTEDSRVDPFGRGACGDRVGEVSCRRAGD